MEKINKIKFPTIQLEKMNIIVVIVIFYAISS